MSKGPWKYSTKRLAVLRAEVSALGDRIEELHIIANKTGLDVPEARELVRLENEMYLTLIERDNCELALWKRDRERARQSD